MEVVVLHPQDSLTNKPSNHYHPIIPHFPNMKLSNPKSHRNSRNRKKRPDPSPENVPGPPRPTSTKPQVNTNKQQQQLELVMGQVKILKRGEQLVETTPDRQAQTETVTSKVDGLYAGYSMLMMSPPPSSVPLPAFITKKIAAVSDATSDLRKMLRLDFA